MNQQKIGTFLKELRNEKKLTQEQFGEILGVSRRTVSRWETGSNMPDLDILIEMADYYEVDLREILNGERKSEDMNKEMKETVLKAVDYTNTEAEKYNKRVRICNSIAMGLFVLNTLVRETAFYADSSVVMACAEVAQGLAIGMLLAGILMSSRYGAKVRAFKRRLFRRAEQPIQ